MVSISILAVLKQRHDLLCVVAVLPVDEVVEVERSALIVVARLARAVLGPLDDCRKEIEPHRAAARVEVAHKGCRAALAEDDRRHVGARLLRHERFPLGDVGHAPAVLDVPGTEAILF
jgi:hypothetical protein